MPSLDPRIAGQLAHDLPPDEFRHVVAAFASDLARLLGELERLGETGDAEGCRRAAHALAGAAAAVGATLLERTARLVMDPRTALPVAQLLPMIQAQARLALGELARLGRIEAGRRSS